VAGGAEGAAAFFPLGSLDAVACGFGGADHPLVAGGAAAVPGAAGEGACSAGDVGAVADGDTAGGLRAVVGGEYAYPAGVPGEYAGYGLRGTGGYGGYGFAVGRTRLRLLDEVCGCGPGTAFVEVVECAHVVLRGGIGHDAGLQCS
jgi:hypothetical protein